MPGSGTMKITVDAQPEHLDDIAGILGGPDTLASLAPSRAAAAANAPIMPGYGQPLTLRRYGTMGDDQMPSQAPSVAPAPMRPTMLGAMPPPPATEEEVHKPSMVKRIGSVLGHVAEAVGEEVVPNAMSVIPGTQAHKMQEESMASTEAATGLKKAQTSQANAEATAREREYKSPKMGTSGYLTFNDTTNGYDYHEYPQDATKRTLDQEEAELLRKRVTAGEDPLKVLGDIYTEKRKGVRQPAGPGKQHVEIEGADGKPIMANYDPASGKYSDTSGMEIPNARPYKPEDKTSALPPEIAAEIGPKPTAPEYGGKKFASVDEAVKAWGLAAEAVKTREAGASSESRGRGYGLGRFYDMLDTRNGNRPVRVTGKAINDEQDRYVLASSGERALNKTALIEDIRGLVGQTKSSLNKIGEASFNGEQRALISAALNAPAGQVPQYITSLARAGLTEDQQDYVQNLLQLNENAMAMRGILGMGQGSDELRAAIKATLPGAGTPTGKYAAKQLEKLESQINRLERGVPEVPLKDQRGLTDKEGNSPEQPKDDFGFKPLKR